MAEQEYKKSDNDALFEKLMNKDDKEVVAMPISTITSQFTLGYPFTGIFQKDTSASSSKISEYVVKKYGKDKALEKVKARGFQSIEAATDELHFDEAISFIPPYNGGPQYVSTLYRSSGGTQVGILAPFDQISPVSQPGPLGDLIYPLAYTTYYNDNFYLVQLYYKDSQGSQLLAYDQRVISSTNTNSMTEYFYVPGTVGPVATKVFTRQSILK